MFNYKQLLLFFKSDQQQKMILHDSALNKTSQSNRFMTTLACKFHESFLTDRFIRVRCS